MDSYATELTKPLGLCFLMLKGCHITYFDEKQSFFKQYWHFLYMMPFTFLYYVSLTLYVKKLLISLKVVELVYVGAVWLITTQAIIKTGIVMLKKAEITALVHNLGTIWQTENQSDEKIEKKDNILKPFNIILRAFYCGSLLAAWQHLLMPLYISVFRFLVLNQDMEYTFPFTDIFPFDPYATWYRYAFAYAFQVYIMLFIVYQYVGTNLLLITFCAQLSTQFALLREDLLNVVPVSKTRKVDIINKDSNHSITIEVFMQRHQRLIKLTEQMDDIFNRLVFTDLLFATFEICFFALGATVAHRAVEVANNFVALVILLFPIGIYCYYGELLKQESIGIADSAYEHPWYEGDVSYQRSICFIIKRAQRMCCLTSMKHVPITLNTFTKMLSNSWSYFSLANSMYSDE